MSQEDLANSLPPELLEMIDNPQSSMNMMGAAGAEQLPPELMAMIDNPDAANAIALELGEATPEEISMQEPTAEELAAILGEEL